jgi:hypothetical protein
MSAVSSLLKFCIHSKLDSALVKWIALTLCPHLVARQFVFERLQNTSKTEIPDLVRTQPRIELTYDTAHRDAQKAGGYFNMGKGNVSRERTRLQSNAVENATPSYNEKQHEKQGLT